MGEATIEGSLDGVVEDGEDTRLLDEEGGMDRWQGKVAIDFFFLVIDGRLYYLLFFWFGKRFIAQSHDAYRFLLNFSTITNEIEYTQTELCLNNLLVKTW